METAKKITRGNDFVLRIPVTKSVSGETFAFPLRACTSITVNLANAYKRYALPYTIEDGTDNVLLARVEGDTLPCGTYALEVKGLLFGNDWRSNEYDQIQIVENNASADTEFVESEGEDSVEMNTAVLVMGAASPAFTPKGEYTDGTTYDKGDVVAYNGGCWWANEQTDTEPSEGNTAWTLLMNVKPSFAIARNRMTVTL